MIRNAVLAVAIGLQFGLSLEHCAAGLKKVQLTRGRLEIKTLGGIRIIDDSYNANPDSMVAALETLAKMPTGGRRIAVLGRMCELGETAAEGHKQVGRAAGEKAIDCVATVGVETEDIAAGARQTGVTEVLEFSTTAEAGEWLRDFAQRGDTVLIKGSRAARMEETLAKLEPAGEVPQV
jgi:UDP-N-acetylmuramoyl-tripeptide--D-alanyl-D-alanine ligase